MADLSSFQTFFFLRYPVFLLSCPFLPLYSYHSNGRRPGGYEADTWREDECQCFLILVLK